MDLEWLQDFVSLANTGSFSHAAEQRNISQSAFSRRIQALENWLGATLIDRHTHPITLTDAGTQLIGSANQVLRTIYKTREDYGHRNLGQLSTLSIGVADHLSIHFAPSWLKAISPELGNRKIKLVTGLKAGLGFADVLVNQEVDFLLAYGGSVNSENGEPGYFKSIPMGEDMLVPVCKSEEHAGSFKDFPGSIEAPLPYVSYMPGSAMSKLINRKMNRRTHPIHLKTVVETGSAECQKALVLAGFGMAWLPHLAITEELKVGSLCEIGEGKYRIPFTIELFRYTANTKQEVVVSWGKLRKNFG
jgi:DNA-binding transcriptional LysR family regulator